MVKLFCMKTHVIPAALQIQCLSINKIKKVSVKSILSTIKTNLLQKVH